MESPDPSFSQGTDTSRVLLEEELDGEEPEHGSEYSYNFEARKYSGFSDGWLKWESVSIGTSGSGDFAFAAEELVEDGWAEWGTDYQIRVRVETDTSYSEWSGKLGFSTLSRPEAPAPTTPDSDAVLSRRDPIDLGWNPAASGPEANAYHVQVKEGSEGWSEAGTDTTGGSPLALSTYQDAVGDSVEPGTVTFRVEARNEAGTSAWSETRTFRALVPPGTPGGLEPQGENASLGPELRWAAPDYGGAYEVDYIYQIRRSGQQWEEVPTRYAGNTSYVYAPLLDPNTSYVFRVRAENALTTGAWSLGQTFTTRGAPRHPGRADTRKISKTLGYDEHGRPTRKKMAALGDTLTLKYREPGDRLSKTELPDVGGGLAVRYRYNDRGLLSEITNEAGNTKAFTYDGLGRLEAVKNDAGQVVTEHDYQYTSGDPSSDPNCVETVQKGGQSPDVVSRKVVDGLGRAWQEVTETGGGNRLTRVTTYDSLGRKARTYRPFEDTDGGLFDGDADYESEPRTKTTYEATPRR